MLSIVKVLNVNRSVGKVFQFIAFVSWLVIASPAPAQEQPTSQPSCVSPAMLQLLTREGDSIRVTVPATSDNAPGRRENEQGIAAAESKDSQRAIQDAHRLFQKAAHKGYAPAQVNLAVLSLGGWGTPANRGAALYWLTEAAHQNYAIAYFDLGVLYLNGCGVRQDYAYAFRYFQQGAYAGDPHSEMNLGYLYDQGLGVPCDRTQAALWYRKSAETGEPQAQFNLADLYLRGEGVPLDESQAFSWFQKAAAQGHVTAQIMLGSMYAAGRGTAKDPAAAYLWLYAASLQGDSRATAQLASLGLQLPPPEIAEAELRAQSLAYAPKKPRAAALGFVH